MKGKHTGLASIERYSGLFLNWTRENWTSLLDKKIKVKISPCLCPFEHTSVSVVRTGQGHMNTVFLKHSEFKS